MPSNLVIVESPAKASTISKYLGDDFIVKSSFGHVRDLQKGNNAIDVENGFTPTYEITKDKKNVIADLKRAVKQVKTVWLATDDDREGEAISWHLKEALNLKDSQIQRIVFREITKNAVTTAIKTPRSIDIDLVNAQQARRILDRLVGFELSPVLWKKIKYGLSAGRVQSASVRIIVERESSIDEFNPTSFFKANAVFDLGNKKQLLAELPSRFKSEEESMKFLQNCVNADFSITNLEKKPSKKSPSPPFTTSTLQQEASRKMGYSVAQTMTLAQRLYEAGHITYMRTDSLNLSNEAIQKAADEIHSSYGEEYVKTRKYKTKSASAQEAHEAIRPSNFAVQSAGKDPKEVRLYQLIWKRAIASQMADAQIEKTIASIGISSAKEVLKASGEVIKFDGFLRVYIASTDDEEEQESKGMLPPLNIGQLLNLDTLKATQRFTRAKARYTEASLVKALEEMGIGRPSTYAPIISTVQKRGYVVKESRDGKKRQYRELTLKKNNIATLDKTEITGAEKNKLFPTDMGKIVNDFLVKFFPNIVNLSFTASVEKKFDEIANGTKQWNAMIGEFYGGFHADVEKVVDIDYSTRDLARDLGTDPKTGKKIIARMARYGAVVELVGNEDDEEDKSKFASLLQGQSLDKITFEEALDLFKLPRDVGMFENKKIVAAIGRFGPYLRHDGKFVSLKKEDNHDPYTVNEVTAIQLIKEKREADAKKIIRLFDERPEVQVLNGRWGAYIKFEKANVKLPKEYKDPEKAAELTLEQCLAIIEKDPKANAKPPVKAKAKAKPKAKAKAAPKKRVTKAKKK
jgi:DNA topoisomerase-1